MPILEEDVLQHILVPLMQDKNKNLRQQATKAPKLDSRRQSESREPSCLIESVQAGGGDDVMVLGRWSPVWVFLLIMATIYPYHNVCIQHNMVTKAQVTSVTQWPP